MDYLITILIGFTLYRNIMSILTYTKSGEPWGTIQWLLLALSVVLVPAFIIFLRRGMKKAKMQQAALEEQENELRRVQSKKMFEILDEDRERSGLDLPEPTEEDLRLYVEKPALEEDLFDDPLKTPEDEVVSDSSASSKYDA